ncbi:MAG: putative membrane protein, partial [Myxococcota bacterium]
MRVLVTTLFLLSIPACNGGKDSGISCDREPVLTFENFGESFLAKHCTGCHSVLHSGDLREGAPLGIDLNTYADVLVWAPRVEVRALESLDRPPG